MGYSRGSRPGKGYVSCSICWERFPSADERKIHYKKFNCCDATGQRGGMVVRGKCAYLADYNIEKNRRRDEMVGDYEPYSAETLEEESRMGIGFISVQSLDFVDKQLVNLIQPKEWTVKDFIAKQGATFAAHHAGKCEKGQQAVKSAFNRYSDPKDTDGLGSLDVYEFARQPHEPIKFVSAGTETQVGYMEHLKQSMTDVVCEPISEIKKIEETFTFDGFFSMGKTNVVPKMKKAGPRKFKRIPRKQNDAVQCTEIILGDDNELTVGELEEKETNVDELDNMSIDQQSYNDSTESNIGTPINEEVLVVIEGLNVIAQPTEFEVHSSVNQRANNEHEQKEGREKGAKLLIFNEEIMHVANANLVFGSNVLGKPELAPTLPDLFGILQTELVDNAIRDPLDDMETIWSEVQGAIAEGAREVILHGIYFGDLPMIIYNEAGQGKDFWVKSVNSSSQPMVKPQLDDIKQVRNVIVTEREVNKKSKNLKNKHKRALNESEIKQVIKATKDRFYPLCGISTIAENSEKPLNMLKKITYVSRCDIRLLSRRQRQRLHAEKSVGKLVIDETGESNLRKQSQKVDDYRKITCYKKHVYFKGNVANCENSPWQRVNIKKKVKKIPIDAQMISQHDENFKTEIKGQCWRKIFTQSLKFGSYEEPVNKNVFHEFSRNWSMFPPLREFNLLLRNAVGCNEKLLNLIIPQPFCYKSGKRLVYHIGYSRFTKTWCRISDLIHSLNNPNLSRNMETYLMNAVVGCEPEDGEEIITCTGLMPEMSERSDLITQGNSVPIIDLDVFAAVDQQMLHPQEITQFQCMSIPTASLDSLALLSKDCYKNFWNCHAQDIYQRSLSAKFHNWFIPRNQDEFLTIDIFYRKLHSMVFLNESLQNVVVYMPFCFATNENIYIHLGEHYCNRTTTSQNVLHYMQVIMQKQINLRNMGLLLVGANIFGCKKKTLEDITRKMNLNGTRILTEDLDNSGEPQLQLLKLLHQQQNLLVELSEADGADYARFQNCNASEKHRIMRKYNTTNALLNLNEKSLDCTSSVMNGKRQQLGQPNKWSTKWKPVLRPLLGIASLELVHQAQTRLDGTWLDGKLSNQVFRMTSLVAIRCLQSYCAIKIVKGTIVITRDELFTNVQAQITSLNDNAQLQLREAKAWYLGIPSSVRLMIMGIIFLSSVHFVLKVFRIHTPTRTDQNGGKFYPDSLQISFQSRQAINQNTAPKQVKMFMAAAGMVATLSMFCDMRTAKYIKEWMDLWWYAVSNATQLGSLSDLIMSPREYLKALMNPNFGGDHLLTERFLKLVHDMETSNNGTIQNELNPQREAFGDNNPISEVQGYKISEVMDMVKEAPFSYMTALQSLREISVTKNSMLSIATSMAQPMIAERMVMIQAPTGSGKSTIFPTYLNAKTQKRILILVPLVAATIGIYERLNEAMPNQVGYFADKTSANIHGKVIVSTYGHFAHKLMQGDEPYDDYGYILADECHVSTLETVTVITDLLSKRQIRQQVVMFMTATPFRRLDLESVKTEQSIVHIRSHKFQSPREFLQYLSIGTEGKISQLAENGCIIFCATKKETLELASFLHAPAHPAIAYHSQMRTPLGEFLSAHKNDLGKIPYFICTTNALESGVTIPARTCIDFSMKMNAQVEGDRVSVSMDRHVISMPEQLQRRGRVARTQPGEFIYTHLGEQNRVKLDPDASVKYLLNCWINNVVCCKEVCDLPDESIIRITRKMVPIMWCHDIPPLVLASLMDHLGCVYQNAHEFCGAFQSIPGQMPGTTEMLNPMHISKFTVMHVSGTEKSEVHELRVPQSHYWFNEPRVIALWENLLKSTAYEITPAENSTRKNNMLARLESQVVYNTMSTDLDLASLLAKFYENVTLYKKQIAAMNSFLVNTLEKTAFLDSIPLMSFANKNIRMKSEKRINEIEQDLRDTEACIHFLEAKLTNQCDTNLTIEKLEQDKIKEYLACLMDIGYARGSYQSMFFLRETTWRHFEDLVFKNKQGIYEQKGLMRRIVETAKSQPWINLMVCGIGLAACCYVTYNYTTNQPSGLNALTLPADVKPNILESREVQYEPEAISLNGIFIVSLKICSWFVLTKLVVERVHETFKQWLLGKDTPQYRVIMEKDISSHYVRYNIYENEKWIISFETKMEPANDEQKLKLCTELLDSLQNYSKRTEMGLCKAIYQPEGRGKLRDHRVRAELAEKRKEHDDKSSKKKTYDPYAQSSIKRGIKRAYRQFYNVDDSDVKEIILHGLKHEPVLIISSLSKLNSEFERVKYADPELYELYLEVKGKLEDHMENEDLDINAMLETIDKRVLAGEKWADIADDKFSEMVNTLGYLVKEASEQAYIPVTVKLYDGRQIQATVANYRGQWQETSWPVVQHDQLRSKLKDALKMLPEGFISKIKSECTLEQQHEIDELVKCILHNDANIRNREAIMPHTQCQSDSYEWTPRVGIVHRKDESGEFTQLFLQCIALNNICIYPYHGWLKEGEELQFHFPTTTFVGQMKRDPEFRNNDIAYTIIPRRIKGISGGVILSQPNENKNVFHFSRIVSQKVKTEAQYQGYSSTAHIDQNCWAHTIPTQVGSCGGPLLNERGHLIGFHVGTAGDYSYNDFLGFSEELIGVIRKVDVSKTQKRQGMLNWRETTFYRTSNYMPPMLNNQFPIPEEWQSPVHKDIKRCTDPDWMASELLRGPSFELLGKMTRRVDYNSKISKNQDFSLWFNLADTKEQFKQLNERRIAKALEPHTISHGVSAQNREAAIIDTMKYNRITTYTWDHDLLQKATHMVINLLEPHIQLCRRQPLDLVFQDMEWSTACGARYDGLKSEFRDRIIGEHNLMAYGEFAWDRFNVPAEEYVPTIWTNSLKDELRPLEKIRENKTRTFTAAPIDFVVGAKQAVDQFNHQFMEKHLILPHTVGINQWAGGWHRLYQKLEGKKFLYSSGDGSRFDSSPPAAMFDALYTIRCHFADSSMWQVLNNIYLEICFTPIVLHDGNIVKKDHGNNSGQCSTVIDNSLIMLILCCAAYIEHTPESWHGIKQLNDNWHFCVNGDDYIGGMSPSLANFLTKDKMAKTFEHFQFKYEWTDYSNSLLVQDYMSLRFIELIDKTENHTYGKLMAPWREGSRQLSTLSHTTSFEPWIKLQVILTERIKAWVDKDLFEFITNYAKWYVNLIGDSCQRKEWLEVQALWWDEQQIFNHYFSRESHITLNGLHLLESMPDGEDIIFGPKSRGFEIKSELMNGNEMNVAIEERLNLCQPEAKELLNDDNRNMTLELCFCDKASCAKWHKLSKQQINQKYLINMCLTFDFNVVESFDAYIIEEKIYEQQKVLFHVWFWTLKGKSFEEMLKLNWHYDATKYHKVARWFHRQLVGFACQQLQKEISLENSQGFAKMLGVNLVKRNQQRQSFINSENIINPVTSAGIRARNTSPTISDITSSFASSPEKMDEENEQQRFGSEYGNQQHRPATPPPPPPGQTPFQYRVPADLPLPRVQPGAHINDNHIAARQNRLTTKYGNLLAVAAPTDYKQDVMGEHAVTLVENRWAARCGLATGHDLATQPIFWRYLFTYVCNNGTSISGNLGQDIVVNQMVIRMSTLIDDAQQHGGWRRYWRSKANDLYDFLTVLKENNQEMPNDWAKKNGFPSEHSQLGFDVVDYCSELSSQEKAVLAATKARAVPRNKGTLVGTSLKPNTGTEGETYGAVDRDIMRDIGRGA